MLLWWSLQNSCGHRNCMKMPRAVGPRHYAFFTGHCTGFAMSFHSRSFSSQGVVFGHDILLPALEICATASGLSMVERDHKQRAGKRGKDTLRGALVKIRSCDLIKKDDRTSQYRCF